MLDDTENHLIQEQARRRTIEKLVKRKEGNKSASDDNKVQKITDFFTKK